MTAPLTHHEIFSLIAPFARRGLQVDLNACDRQARTVVFKPVAKQDVGVTEVIALQQPTPDQQHYRLTRTLHHRDGLQAQLQLEGRDNEALLQQLSEIGPGSQFSERGGVLIASSYALDAGKTTALRLTAAEATIAGIRAQLAVPGQSLLSVTLSLLPDDNPVDRLPDDLLAVLGHAWRPLRFANARAHTQLRAPRREPARSRAAGQGFAEAVTHLAAALAQPPAHYHPRFKLARWVVVLRRSLPLLGCLGLLALALALQFLVLNRGVELPPLALFIPPLLMVASLILTTREMPAFELPPLPKPLPDNAWRTATQTGVQNR